MQLRKVIRKRREEAERQMKIYKIKAELGYIEKELIEYEKRVQEIKRRMRRD